MSTLRISNIEAKANSSSPSVDEKLKFTNSSGDVLVHLDGKTSGITTIGINTTAESLKFDSNNNIYSTGIITATKFSGIIDATTASFSGNVSIAGTLTYQDVTNIDSVGIITARAGIIAQDDVEFVGPTAGITSVTWDKSANKLIFKDNSKLVLGTGEDFTMHHDGLGNTILQNDNNLYIKANSTYVEANQGEPSAYFLYNGPVKLFYDGGTHTTPKLQTSGIGVTVTGTIDLDAISTTISDTAVDLFVYDTRKDSDGGAWRKRTGHTSWYNETFGSARGSKKEFPAVAVIVVEAAKVTIYDADDPTLPMWMLFETGNGDGQNRMLNRFMVNLKSVSMLNGNLFICGNSTSSGDRGGCVWINFISEVSYAFGTNDSQAENIYGFLAHTISQRNTILGTDIYGDKDTKYQLVDNSQCNDVAMTVLPNAPIDTDTGLPVPTIAVATNGGFSVIRDDGTVIDKGVSGTVTNEVDWYKGQYLLGTGPEYWALYKDLSEESGGYISGTADLYSAGNNTTWDKPQPTGKETKVVAVGDLIAGGSATAYTGQQPGLSLKHPTSNLSNGSSNLLCEIRKDYNTGWMHGDIKGAWLADTDDTNITGTSLIANGDFSSSSTAAFTTVAGGTAAVVGGLLKLTDTGGAFCYASAPFTTVVGNQYFVTVDIVNNSNTAPSNYIRCGNSHNGTEFHNTNYGTGYGTKTFYFTATATTTYLTLISGHGAGNPFGHWDNVFVYKLDNDRSMNTKGLRPRGTVTKTAVATGAELVSYGGFSASNYFDFDSFNFGTGDFSVSVWAIPSTDTTNEFILELDDSSQGSNRFYLLVTNTATKKLYVPWDSDIAGSELIAGVWNHIVVGRRSGMGYVYVNGKSIADGTDAWTTSLNGNGRGTIGNYSGGPSAQYAWSGSLALLRISGSMPTTEQVEKMYNDEKHLFVTNAKCTLYGSSNAVTAVAYDDSTNNIHVGTSAGRSEFSGLNRINNTTTAVTAAISASNRLVVDE